MLFNRSHDKKYAAVRDSLGNLLLKVKPFFSYFRFPQRSLINSFYVMSMRTINFEKDPDTFGNKEIEQLLQHFGEEKVKGDYLKVTIFSN